MGKEEEEKEGRTWEWTRRGGGNDGTGCEWTVQYRNFELF